MAKSHGTLALDIQRNYICVLQYSSRDNSVKQVAILPLPVSADFSAGQDTVAFWDAVGAGLREVRRQQRLGGSLITCSLSSDMAVVMAVEADSDERDQLSVLRWELEANLAAPVDGYAFDFYEVDPGLTVDRRRYVAVAARAEAVTRLSRAVRSAKLNPHIIDIDIFALTNAFKSNYRERLGEASILVHGELQRTKMILVYNSSYIAHCVGDFDAEGRGGAAYAGMLRGEAARLMEYGAAAGGIPGDGDGAGIYLAGGLFADKNFVSAVLGALPRAEALDPFRKVGCDVDMPEDERGRLAPQLAVAVGLALRGEEV